MKVVILAGGFGTRISEESFLKPKPMIEIGEYPILWHIMKGYSAYGHNEFIICGGYKQYVIKEYFANYFLHNHDITFDFSNGNHMIVHNSNIEPWKVTVVDTGLHTMTGGRIKRIQSYVKDETFLLTYGDGVSDIDLSKLLHTHKSSDCIGTISAYRPEGRFGVLEFEDTKISKFREKIKGDEGWINCGFMVMEPVVFDYIQGDDTVFEQETLSKLAEIGQLNSYKHDGFWQCMDTMRDKEKLEQMWKEGNAPWKVWG